MNKYFDDQSIAAGVLEAIRAIAPEVDVDAINPEQSLREQVDLDSMDFFRLLVLLHEKFAIEIPEADYAHFGTVRGCVEYIGSRIARKAAG